MAKQNDDDKHPPHHGPVFAFMTPEQVRMMQETQRATTAALDAAKKALNTEVEIEYNLLHSRAVEFDWVLAEPPEDRKATIEMAAAGVVRHRNAGRLAGVLARAHSDSKWQAEYRARKREHMAACDRWHNLLVEATGIQEQLDAVTRAAAPPGD